MKKYLKKAMALLLGVLLVFGMIPATALMADEAEETWIEIYTVDDLYDVRNDLTANYKLMNDLDLTEATAEGGVYDFKGHGWKPIGVDDNYSATSFTGKFDGCGHTISGMRISGSLSFSNYVYVGLFGAINNAIIKNLKMTDVKIDINVYAKGNIYIGILAASADSSVIESCSVSGDLVASCKNDADSKYNSSIGGILGEIRPKGEVAKCSNLARIFVTCDTSGNVGSTCPSWNVGGIVGGSIYSSGSSYIRKITLCSNWGDISTNCIGFFDNKIYEGGIIGGGIEKATIDSCYNAGKVKNPIDGTTSATISKSYSVAGGTGEFKSPTSYYLAGTAASSSTATSLTDYQMRRQESFAGFDFDTIWTMDPQLEYPYPTLQWEEAVDTVELKTVPAKTSYYTTDSKLDLTGGKLRIYFDDETNQTVDILDSMIAPYDLSTPGTKTISITYHGKTITYDITVVDRGAVTGLQLLSGPNKTTFVKGTAFDFTGAKAKITYANGQTETVNITPEMVTGADITHTGDYEAVFTTGGKSVKFNVKVVPVIETAFAISTKPAKLTYNRGEALDLTGMVCTITKNNGTSANTASYHTEGDTTTCGTKTIKVIYNADETFFDTFEIEVVANIAGCDVEILDTDLKYTGTAQEPAILVKDADKTLVKGVDYTVTYSNNILPGTDTGVITIQGKGIYSGTKVVNFSIEKVDSVAAFLESEVTKEVGAAPFVNELTTETDGTIGYTSSNTSVATVNAAGVVTILAAGTTTITANITGGTIYQNQSASYTLNVTKAKSSGAFAELVVTKNITDAKFTNALTATTDGQILYTSNNPSVATVDALTGEVTIVSAGSAKITATIYGCTNYLDTTLNYRLIVNKLRTEMAFDADAVEKTYGDDAFTNVLTYLTDGEIVYSSSNPDVATVDQNGEVTILGGGTTIIKAKTADCEFYTDAEKTYTLTVKKLDQTLTAKASATTIVNGKTATITATGTGKITYTSSDTTIATVSSAGVVTAKKVGSVTITVKAAGNNGYNAATKTLTMKVTPAATTKTTLENVSAGIKITWAQVTGATGYYVYRGSTKIATIKSGTTLTYTDKSTLTNGTKYAYKVVAYAATGTGASGTAVSTYRLSSSAISSATNSAAGKATVKWAKNAKATGYEIKYVTGTTTKTITVSGYATVSTVISSLKKGSTYKFYVRSYKTVSGVKYYSAWSEAVSLKITK